MGGTTFIDLFASPFWIIFILAIICLRSNQSYLIRKSSFAILNLSFIALILKFDVAFITVSLFLFWIFIKNINCERTHQIMTFVACLIVGSLFVFHKIPILAISFGFGTLNPILAAFGFSYIALRCIEVIRGIYEKKHSAPDFVSLINYLIPFHMLASGPIQSFDDYCKYQKKIDNLNFEKTFNGAQRIILGMFKKYVLAFTVDRIFLTGFEASGLYFFIEVQFFFLWVYLDFSAYSDIAVGVGKIIGISTPENFNKPYIARNMIDFWERWHISLSQFIRHNLFIPIQLWLMRQTNAKNPLLSATFAFTVSFLLCGLWHNISLRFLLWGGMHAFGLVICNLYKHILLKKWGRKGIKKYSKNIPIRIIASIINYEFVAFSLVIVAYPFSWG